MTSQSEIEKAYEYIHGELKRWEIILSETYAEQPKASDTRIARIEGRIVGLEYGKTILHRLVHG